jgi:uncharacterized protein YijF (DUF1287 family)
MAASLAKPPGVLLCRERAMTNILSEISGGLQVVHNIGAGIRVEDVLFDWRIIGHYRHFN